jgi:DHA2 family multidrug resistance protein
MAIWGSGIMVAPILGPTLGGWLTENYDWRWVFYINVPIGIMAFAGIAVFVRQTLRDRRAPFDLFGFAFLSLAIGGLQIMLDRGELKDWFGSSEIIMEASLAALGLWIFVVHTVTSEKPFFNPGLLRDRNFVAGTILMFLAGGVMYGTLALLPPLLAMMNYPVVTIGLLLAPRGITTMIFMMIVGRLIGKVDIRLIVLFGFGVTVLSLYQMTYYSPDMDWWPIVTAGLVQGAGLGFVFVPVSTIAFSTLPQALRTEGSGVYSLLRNIGGSIGISVVEALLDRNVQINHSTLVQNVSPYNKALQQPAIEHFWSLHTTGGLAALDHLVTMQASFIAYIDVFKLMMIVSILGLPLILLLRPARQAAPAAVMAE